MNISRKEIDDLIKPGYVIAVEYLKPDCISRGLAWGQGGGATHALCCLGGLDIVEATALGVYETNLHNYLRGNCRLTVRRSRISASQEQVEKATDFWDARVLDPYDWRMIFGSIPILLAHKVIGLFSKRLADEAVHKMPNLLASSILSTCAELGIRGIRKFDESACSLYFAEDVDPEVLQTDDSLVTVIVLIGATLVG